MNPELSIPTPKSTIHDIPEIPDLPDPRPNAAPQAVFRLGSGAGYYNPAEPGTSYPRLLRGLSSIDVNI